ncbi:hypothetical protein [Aureimonas sp. N4]|uniref:hypothetical protein n=1 Tax=Aureimonas sp. N4 TaxID=1638165 RepID=UPI0012E38FA3|nr:hypothetical protein [Aureimonas sp. N4]
MFCALRFGARPTKRAFGFRHGEMCRRWGGCDFTVTPGESVSKLTQSEMVGIYPSSNGSEWLVCRDGGSSIAWRPRDGFQHAEAVQVSDDLSRFVSAEKVFVDAKPSMYDRAYPTHKLTGATAMAQSANEQGA